MASVYNPLKRPGFNPALVDPNYAQYGFGDDPDILTEPVNPLTQSASPGGIYGDVGSPQNVNTGQYAGPTGPTGIPTLNTDPNQDIHNSFYADQGIINAGGQQINQEAQQQLKHYDPLQQEYEGKSREALDKLKQTPGYTADEAGKIGVDYGRNKTSAGDLDKRFLTSDEQRGIAGDPSKALATTYGGTDAEGKVLNDYEANLGAQAQNYGTATDASLGDYRSSVGGAVGGLKSGLDASQGKFSKLDEAVNNPALAFDPNSTEKQLTDQDVDAMKTAAGVRVGNSYQTAKDDLQRSAAAAGNTSPLAVAAARARLEHQSASDSGQAEAAADIAARQTQYQRAADIEKQREGAVGTQTGYKVGAATTEQKQAQDAAALAGVTDVNSQQALGQSGVAAKQKAAQANIDAANASGTAALATRTKMTDQEAAAQNLADQTGASRAAATAANRQNVQAGVTDTQYQQGMATDTANAGGAKVIGDARQQGEGAYRSGVQQQQTGAQQGGQKAVDQQQAAFSTTAGGLNTSTANRANYEVGGTGNSALNQGVKVAGAIFGHEDGYVADEPEVAKLGEHGPEMVIPLEDGGTGPSAIQKLGQGLGHYASQRWENSPANRFMDNFKQHVQDSGKPSADVNSDPGLSGQPTAPMKGPDQTQSLQNRVNGVNDDQAGANGALMDALPMYGSGKMVSKPTIAMIGDKGPEMVLPMNGKGSNKTDGLSLNDQAGPRINYPVGGTRSRFRHVSGPNSVGRHRPLPNELPLLPNKMQR